MMYDSRAGASNDHKMGEWIRVGKSMAISLFLALPEIRAVDAMPCL